MYIGIKKIAYLGGGVIEFLMPFLDNFGSQNLFWGGRGGGVGEGGGGGRKKRRGKEAEGERSGGGELAEGNRPPGCLIVP